MPQVIATTVYRIDELPQGAKDSARAWYREGGFDYDWYDAVYEDFQRIAEILGIRLKTRTTRLIGGRTREDPCIWFSGFWSQGDGAAWEGVYSYRKSAAAELHAYAPKDKTLHRIAETLQAAQRQNFYQLRAEVTHRGNYYHGIIALGLGLGRTAKELLELYERRGPVIFGEDNADGKPPGRMRQAWRTLTATGRHAVGPKHDAAILARELKAVLNDDLIGQSQTRLVIPAWDADLRSPYIYKTAHHTRLQTDYRKTALDAALATAAAPTYFKRHRTADDIGLTDGGTWANNPTAIAVVEAITLLGWHPSDLRILSLGCLDEVYMLPESPGFAGLGLKVLNLYADGQSHGALGMAKLLTGHPYDGDRIYRISPSVPSGFFTLDDTTKIGRLKGLGMSEARKAKPHLTPIFFTQPADTFVPVHQLKENAA